MKRSCFYLKGLSVRSQKTLKVTWSDRRAPNTLSHTLALGSFVPEALASSSDTLVSTSEQLGSEVPLVEDVEDDTLDPLFHSSDILASEEDTVVPKQGDLT